MAHNKAQGIVYENVEITDITTDGAGVGKFEQLVLFVDKTVPGDVVDAKVYRAKSSYRECEAIHFHQYSSHRVHPECAHFGECGGCLRQHIGYDMQLRLKVKVVKDAFDRIARMPTPAFDPIIQADEIYFYRNKLDFSFSPSRWLTKQEISSGNDFKGQSALGFHAPGKFDKVIAINQCHLQADPSNAIRAFVHDYAVKHQMPYYDVRRHTGNMRSLILRNTTLGEWMLILSIHTADEQVMGLLDALRNQFNALTSIMYVENKKKNDTIHDLDVKCFAGKAYITEDLDGLKFRIGPKSFFQTNSHQTLKLYRATKEFAGLSGDEVVYDLYTGTGTIACYLARYCKKVIGVEYVEDAVKDAFINAAENNIENVDFYAGDMKNVINLDFIEKHGKPDVIITDPPRAGMHESVVQVLLKSDAKKIVYVSCNPATQARDVAMLAERYKVTKVQPVDMFPHTNHVENIVLLELI